MRVVAFNGSARKGGNTAILLRHVLNELEKEGIETELVEMSGAAIHGCLACHKCSARKDGRCSQTGDMGNVYIDKMAAANGILLGSPTYVADISPEIKALIDRACLVSKSNGGMFRRKVGAGVIAVRRAGAIHARNPSAPLGLAAGAFMASGRFEDLARIEDALGVQRLLQRPHQRDLRR